MLHHASGWNVRLLAFVCTCLLVCAGALLNRPCWAATNVFTVTLTTDAGTTDSTVIPLGPGAAGDLRNAIFQAGQNPTAQNVIDLRGVSGTITLSTMLPPLFTTGSGSLLIIGPGSSTLTISGNNVCRPFFIVQGTVGIANLTIANGQALGGAGGNGSPAAGGGGAGLGGGLLIDGTVGSTTVTVTNVNFSGNRAIGGAGGNNSVVATGGGGGAGGAGGSGNNTFGGGGGFLGNGGTTSTITSSTPGGGGGGFTGSGGAPSGTTAAGNGTSIGGGGGGTITGTPGTGSTGGGNGAAVATNGGPGGGGGSIGIPGSSAGANAVGNIGGSGGFGGGGGGAGNFTVGPNQGGDGGDYGGGGGGGTGGSGGRGGNGGFGGGGGGGGFTVAGNGGFGGGGGGSNFGTPGTGGSFGGNGGSFSTGGGGAGLGGAVFQRGGSLYLINTSYSNNAATGGASGGNVATIGVRAVTSIATAGTGNGGAIFINAGATAKSVGTAPTFSGNKASDANADLSGILTTDAAASLTATSGTPQSAPSNAAFATLLQVSLKDGANTAIPVAPITFAAPGSGASATLSPNINATDISGLCSVTATANSTAGSYNVAASVGGLTATFALTNTALPVVTTPTSASITDTTATLGGNVISEGSSALTERGVVYALTTANANPAIGGTGVTKVSTSGSTGVFTVGATGLTALSGYSYKAYASNSSGTSYTSVASFTTSAPSLTIVSGPTALPNPAGIGQTVSFSATATGGVGKYTYTWDFADGTATTTGAGVTHIYTAAGTYLVKVTVTSGESSVSGTVSVKVGSATDVLLVDGVLKLNGPNPDEATLLELIKIDPKDVLATGNNVTIVMGGLTQVYTVDNGGTATSKDGVILTFDTFRRGKITVGRFLMLGMGQLKEQLYAGLKVDGAGHIANIPIMITINGVTANGTYAVKFIKRREAERGVIRFRNNNVSR